MRRKVALIPGRLNKGMGSTSERRHDHARRATPAHVAHEQQRRDLNPSSSDSDDLAMRPRDSFFGVLSELGTTILSVDDSSSGTIYIVAALRKCLFCRSRVGSPSTMQKHDERPFSIVIGDAFGQE